MGIPEQEWARERGRLFLPGMAEGRWLSALPGWANPGAYQHQGGPLRTALE